jgi:predicted ATPase
MLTLRSATGLTQASLAEYLGVTRRSVGEWEVGSSYPKAEHLKQFIVLACQHQAFAAGREAEEIRALWRSARQKVILDEAWLAGLVAAGPGRANQTSYSVVAPPGGLPRTAPGQFGTIELPAPPTPLIGRDAELSEIDRLLADPACRLLTLVGPGGAGKTHLALEVARAQTHAFADGAVFVALASIDQPSQIAPAIGEALHLSFAGRADPDAHLLAVLRERHMLLVLDNLEQLVAGGELINGIVTRAPRVSLLVTSRERLNLQAEWVFELGGLAYPPDNGHSLSAPQRRIDPMEFSAIQLFVRRSRQVQPRLQLSETMMASIVRICQQLAGLPLAIELAAASLRFLPLHEIDRQIRLNLDVLATTGRDVPGRHRSLRAVFDHSWNLLDKPERALLARLAVFRGGCTFAAASQVAGASLTALIALLDKSLLQRAAGVRSEVDHGEGQSTNQARFLMLEPIQEYALEKLAARGEAESLRRAHAEFFLALAETAAAHWDHPAAEANIADLDDELDNLRAALQWARDGGDVRLGFRLGAALRRFWWRRGYLSEGRDWLEGLLARDDGASGPGATLARISAMNAAAWLASYKYDFARAKELFEASTALSRELGETQLETSLLDNAGRQARAAGHYTQATALFEDALALHRAIGDRRSLASGGLGLSLYEVGLVRREQGDLDGAAEMFNACTALHREIGDEEGVGVGLMGLSDVARDRGDVAQLRLYGQASLELLRKLGTQWAIGFTLNNLALAAYLQGSLADASALAHEAVALYRAQQAEASLAEVLVTLGRVLQRQGNEAGAYAALTEALRLAQVTGPQILLAATLEALAGLTVEQSNPEPAIRLMCAAQAMRSQMGTPVRPSDQTDLEHALTSARAAVGSQTFATLCSAAGQLPVDEILSAIFGASSSSAVLLPANR